jgi:membrane protein YqaA with SNARE-associated domain
MLKTLYDRTLHLSSHPKSVWFLGLVSFIESSFFPIPPDVMLAPMILANRQKTWFYATICTITSILGGLFGYFIGYAFFQSIGVALIEFYGHQEGFTLFQDSYNEHGAWIVFAGGITPLPYKIITITSGAVGMNVLVFLIASLLSRGLRFFIIAGLLWFFGPTIKKQLDRHLTIITILFFILLLAGFYMIKILL